MQGDGFDRARAVLEPFRFGFPRAILGIAIFPADVVTDYRPDKTLQRRVQDAILDIAKTRLPAGLVEIETDGGTTSLTFDNRGFHDLHLLAEHRPDLTLLKTAAMYAGRELPLPDKKIFWTTEEESPCDDDWLCSWHLRWYVRLTEDSRFSKDLSDEFTDKVELRVCDDAFGASWSLVNELLGPMTVTETHAEAKNLGAKASSALEIIRADGPIQGKALAKQINLEFSTFRRHIVPKLKACGVKNDGDGYYVAPM